MFAANTLGSSLRVATDASTERFGHKSGNSHCAIPQSKNSVDPDLNVLHVHCSA